MSFSDLLSGYAKSKTEPPVEKRKGPAPPKPHYLQPVLEKFRSNTVPIASSGDRLSAAEFNLGILIMIIDDCPNELLWRLWLEQANSTGTYQESPKVRIWFHAKCPDKIRSPWVRERLVRGPNFKPEWGSIEITKVMAHMLHEALVDAPHIHKFCFASESCIPIRSLETTLRSLYDQCTDSGNEHLYWANSSWLCYSDTPNNGYAKQLQHDPLSRALPAGCVYKASQWVLLARPHAQAVIDLMQRVGADTEDKDKDKSMMKPVTLANTSASDAALPPLPLLSGALFSAFTLVGKASDEMFFPCCLAVLGAIPSSDTLEQSTPGDTLTEPIQAVVLKRQVTYCDWTHNAKSPQEYTSFPTPLVTALTQSTDGATSTTSSAKQTHEALHIHPEQLHTCFLRKIKFPIRYFNNTNEKNNDRDSTVEVSEVQEVFLKKWLPFIVGTTATGSDGDGDGDDVELDKHMPRARTLLGAIANYAAPARAISKRPLPAQEEEEKAHAGGSGGDGVHSGNGAYARSAARSGSGSNYHNNRSSNNMHSTHNRGRSDSRDRNHAYNWDRSYEQSNARYDQNYHHTNEYDYQPHHTSYGDERRNQRDAYRQEQYYTDYNNGNNYNNQSYDCYRHDNRGRGDGGYSYASGRGYSNKAPRY